MNGGFQRAEEFERDEFCYTYELEDGPEVVSCAYSEEYLEVMKRAKIVSRGLDKRFANLPKVVERHEALLQMREDLFEGRAQQFSYVDYLYEWAAPSWFAEVSDVREVTSKAKARGGGSQAVIYRRAYDFGKYRLVEDLSYSPVDWPSYMDPTYKDLDFGDNQTMLVQPKYGVKASFTVKAQPKRATGNGYATRSRTNTSTPASTPPKPTRAAKVTNHPPKLLHRPRVFSNFLSYTSEKNLMRLPLLRGLVLSPERRVEQELPTLDAFSGYVYPAASHPPLCRLGPQSSVQDAAPAILRKAATPFYSLVARRMCKFPEKGLLQYDCGKFVVLARLLHKLRAGGHKCLIFTQMAKMLDILEQFINFHRFVYVRLDGSTKLDDRQRIVERFNQSDKIFLFISSTRSGGVGTIFTPFHYFIFSTQPSKSFQSRFNFVVKPPRDHPRAQPA